MLVSWRKEIKRSFLPTVLEWGKFEVIKLDEQLYVCLAPVSFVYIDKYTLYVWLVGLLARSLSVSLPLDPTLDD